MSLGEAEINGAIEMLAGELSGGKGDRQEIWLEVRTLIKHLQGSGAAVPADLAKMEADMKGEFDD